MGNPAIDAVFSGFSQGVEAAQATLNGAVQIADTVGRTVDTVSDICSRRDANYNYQQRPQGTYQPAAYVWATQPGMYGGGFSQVISGYPGISNDGYGKTGYVGTSGYNGGFNFQVPTGASGAWYSDPRIGGGQW